jgi:hypothetical protein
MKYHLDLQIIFNSIDVLGKTINFESYNIYFDLQSDTTDKKRYLFCETMFLVLEGTSPHNNSKSTK